MPDPGEERGSLVMKPTMGPEGDQYRLLLNVTPRNGKLERRPAIIAKHLGYGYPGNQKISDEAFQFDADGTANPSAVYTPYLARKQFKLTLGAGGGSDTPIPANGSYFTITLRPIDGVPMEIKVAFSPSGTSDAAFQSNGTNKVIMDLYAGDTDTDNCLEIANHIRGPLNSLTTTAANGVNLFGWSVSSVAGAAGARIITFTADDDAVASNYAAEPVESGDSNNTILFSNLSTVQSFTQYSGSRWVKPGMCPVDHEQVKHGGVFTPNYPYEDTATNPAPKWERKDIVEGIDVEIVNGKLIAFYAARHRWQQTTGSDAYNGTLVVASNNDVRMCVSVHSTADPMIGYLGISQLGSDLWSSSPLQSLSPDFTADFSSKRVGSVKGTEASHYLVNRYWEKRVQRIGSGFVISGYGVGGGQWGTGLGFTQFTENLEVFDDSGLQTFVTTTIDDPDGLLWFHGLQLPWYRFGDPVTDVHRYLSKNQIYAQKRPHNAFMFMTPEGYPVWYGFQRGDIQEVQQTEAFNNAFNEGVPVQLRSGTKYFLDPGMVWFAEQLIPNSLPAMGYFTAVESSRNPEVVGLSKTTIGVVAFTHDSIELLGGNYFMPDNKTVHIGIGADSRWSIANVGRGTAFLNKDGLHHLAGTEEGVKRITAFDGLFGSGVDFERGPYSDLILGDSGHETVANHANSTTKYSQEFAKIDSHGSVPFGTYRVDKTRIDRAVSGVWEDLYLCAVSRDIDEPGDDNRMVLVWNYKDDTSSVWLLPKGMGIRGFAYDGSISAPYIMTRYGVAQFGGTKQHDEPFWKVPLSVTAPDKNWKWRADIKSERNFGVWGISSADVKDMQPVDWELLSSNLASFGTAADMNDQYSLNVLVAGQTHLMSGGNDTLILPNIMITHEKTRYGWTRIFDSVHDQGEWADFKKDDDTDMRVQTWGNNTDVEAGTTAENWSVSGFSAVDADYDVKAYSQTDIGLLDSLYKGTSEKEFRAVRVHPENIDGASKTVDHTHGHSRYGSFTFNDSDRVPSRRTRGPILRTSTARSHVAATRHQFQFFTFDPGKIFSVMLETKPIAPPGGRG